MARLSTDRRRASWIFSSVLLLFLAGVFVVGPETLPVFKQRILVVIAALLVALMTYFLTGSIALRMRTRHPKLGSILITSAGGLAAAVVIVWWWHVPDEQVAVPQRVQIDVLAVDGRPVPTADLRASVAGAFERTGMSWLFTSRQPARFVTFEATQKETFERGMVTVDLGSAVDRVEIRLSRDRSADVRGVVRDHQGGAPLDNVRVTLSQGVSVQTDTAGRFEFDRVAATGEALRVRFERDQYHTEERELIAGLESDVRLERIR